MGRQAGVHVSRTPPPTMRQSLLIKPGRIDLTDIPVPTPGDGELLVKVRAALTCGTDLKAYRRGHPVIPMPGPFGHEFSGTVAKKGRGARNFRDGDEIMAVHSAPCLKCPFCKKRLYNLCENIMTTKVMGAFAEYVLLPAQLVKQNVFHKPSTLSYEEAALLEPFSCVVHGMAPLGIRKGATAVIIGGGSIGLIHVMLLKAAGARVIIADPHKERLAMATEFGADITCEPKGIMAAAQALTGGMGVDFVFECTGKPDVWQSSIAYARRGGTVTLFGGCPSGTSVSYDTHRIHYDEITLRGVFHFTPADVRRAFKILASGRLKLGMLITGKYPLAELGKAFDKLSKGQGIKYAIIP